MELNDLVYEEGSPNAPGQGSLIYAIPASYKTGNMTLDASRNVISVPLAEGKSWKKQYATDGTVEIKDTIDGDNDCRSWKSSLSFFYPGTKADALKHFGDWTNGKGYLITKDCSTGAMRILGTDCKPARMTNAEITSGGDKRGCTLTFETEKNAYPAFTYTGESPYDQSETGSGSGSGSGV